MNTLILYSEVSLVESKALKHQGIVGSNRNIITTSDEPSLTFTAEIISTDENK